MIVDAFHGAGGWSEGLRALGRESIGVEIDPDMVATSRAAAHRVELANVAAIDPRELVPSGQRCEGVIASPPCPSFSAGGKRLGRQDLPAIHRIVADLARGIDSRDWHVWHDFRSRLTAEPMRWIQLLDPEWVALEQVPAVMPVWQDIAGVLRSRGFQTWTGVVYAERYGVPQTRQRAVLMAHKRRKVEEPVATHRRWYPERSRLAADPPDAHLPRWVSMSQALGWGMTERPSMTVTSGGTYTGGAETFGKGARNGINREREAGRWSPWMDTRPSTTVQGDPRISGPGHKDGRPGSGYPRQQDSAIRVSPAEAGVLQTFPYDYPWKGTQGKQHMQAGNANPPLLAKALLASLI